MAINLALSAMGATPLSKLLPKEKNSILKTAREAIQYGLTYQQRPTLQLSDYTPALLETKATFVTLKKNGALRGCIGSLKAHQPLIQDVADNAYSAAFNDPRFPPVGAREAPELHISVSILSNSEKMTFKNETDLLGKLVPGRDGIILNYRGLSSTFLPSVWEELPTPIEFMAHLKQKAGLEKNFWSNHITIKRYYTDIIE